MAPGRERRSGPQRALRREVTGTVAVLARAADFARMRAYRSFTFDDHQHYLRQTEGLLRSLAADGLHARVAGFDPADYGRFCRDEQLDPDTPASRTRYVAEVASATPTVAYDGQPMPRLLARLTEEQASRAVWEQAARVLSTAGACPECGTDLARSAFDRAAHALALLLGAVGEGSHHLVCTVVTPDGPLVTFLDARTGEEGPRVRESAAVALTTVLAAGLACGGSGGLVLRTERSGSPDQVRGWRLRDAWPTPLTAAEVFAAYCTDAATGEPIPPERGVEHLPGLDLPAPGGDPHW